jgi:hypothetical protein
MALVPASADFLLAIRDALVEADMFKDTIVVLDPTNLITTPFNPFDDTGGEESATVLLGPRPAYIQALSSSVETEAGLLQGIVRYVVQFIPEPGDPLVGKGMIVRVLEGGDNEALPYLAIEVLGAPTGSIAALTKLECQANGNPAPVWVAS